MIQSICYNESFPDRFLISLVIFLSVKKISTFQLKEAFEQEGP